MKSYVDLEGSGQQATIIQGAGAADSSIAVVNAAASSELRDLQVKSTGGSSDGFAVPLLITTTNTNVRRVTVTASGPSTCSLWGIRLVGMTGTIDDVTVNLSGGGIGQGIVSKGSSAPKIHRAHITVTGSTSSAYGFLASGGGAFPEIEESRVEVSGGTSDYGLYQESPSTASKISHSTIYATSFGVVTSTSLSIDSSEIAGAAATVMGGVVTIGGSKLDGGPTSGATKCAGVWDESYTFFAGPACP